MTILFRHRTLSAAAALLLPSLLVVGCASSDGTTPDVDGTVDVAGDAGGSDTDAPDTDAPDTDAPDTDVPDTDVPDTDVPDTDVPDTDAPDTDAPDTALDTDMDTALDTGTDTALDTGTDTALDTGMDAALDTSMDTALDTGMDTALDTGMDTALDTGMDTALDTGVDTALDTGMDADAPGTCTIDDHCAVDQVCIAAACVPVQVLTLAADRTSIAEDGTTAVLEVTSPTPAVQEVVLDIAVAGTASTGDYALSATRLRMPAGTSSVEFTLRAALDTTVERNETVELSISTEAHGVVIDTASVSITIVDDDELARDAIDWIAQDYIPGDPGADPYCAPELAEEAHISTALGYLRTDAAGDEGGISAFAPAYNPERQRWELRGLTTFDFRPYAESQPGVGGIPNGADVFEAEGRYVSIVGTNDSGGVAGWASSWGDGCQFFDGWISYDRYDVPDFNPSDRNSWASVSSPIEGVPSPMRDNCPAGFGSTTTRWTFVSDYTFAGESICPGDTGRKVMDTIVSDHDGGNHHEVFYFTDEYGGKSRWERWECGIPYPDHDYITARCQYNEAQSVMHMAYGINDDRRTIVDANGATCYMTDCRDFTTVEPIDAPGYRAAAWHHGAIVYFSGNLLRNGDFNSNGDGWHSEATTAEVDSAADGNRYLRISAPTTGWHSVLSSSIDEFNRLFDAGGEEAYLPKYLHWGARVRHDGSGGTARLALVEWGNPGGEIIDERGLTPGAEWEWVTFHRLMGPSTNMLDIRFRLDGMAGLEVDDVYIYISNDPER